MRIGLIDVDGHASKKKWGATIYPNIALAKIARFHKELGDEVEWYSPFCEHYGIVYMSKVFNFTPDYPYIITNAWKVMCGGTGYMGKTAHKDYIVELKGKRTQTRYIYNLCTYSGILSSGSRRLCPSE